MKVSFEVGMKNVLPKFRRRVLSLPLDKIGLEVFDEETQRKIHQFGWVTFMRDGARKIVRASENSEPRMMGV